MATILLADDDGGIRDLYSRCLSARGHTVITCQDGVEALDAVRQHTPDLMLLDLWMPRLNGFEVLETLRHEPASTRTRVVVFSVLGEAETQLEAFSEGAVEFLVKGQSIERFLVKIEQLLQIRVDPDPTA